MCPLRDPVTARAPMRDRLSHMWPTHILDTDTSKCSALTECPHRSRGRLSMLTLLTLHPHVRPLHSACHGGTHGKEHSCHTCSKQAAASFQCHRLPAHSPERAGHQPERMASINRIDGRTSRHSGAIPNPAGIAVQGVRRQYPTRRVCLRAVGIGRHAYEQ